VRKEGRGYQTTKLRLRRGQRFIVSTWINAELMKAWTISEEQELDTCHAPSCLPISGACARGQPAEDLMPEMVLKATRPSLRHCGLRERENLQTPSSNLMHRLRSHVKVYVTCHKRGKAIHPSSGTLNTILEHDRLSHLSIGL
jgi:hypothetical protein